MNNRYLRIFAACYEYTLEKAENKSLTVGELIEMLKEVDPDEKVVLATGGYYTPMYGPVITEYVAEFDRHADEDGDEDEEVDLY